MGLSCFGVYEMLIKDTEYFKELKGDSRRGLVSLKVKIKSLATEAEHIRLEEEKAKNASKFKTRRGLSEHRRVTVRRAARATLIAYGFLKGKKFNDIEKVSYEQPNWSMVRAMVRKYGCEVWREGDDLARLRFRGDEIWKCFNEFYFDGYDKIYQNAKARERGEQE